MNIVISPNNDASIKDILEYSYLFRSVINKVLEKNPNIPRLLVTIDDTSSSCNHEYCFTGITMGDKAQVKCLHCNDTISVKINRTHNLPLR